MMAVTYETLVARWSPQDKTDHSFNIITTVTLLIFLAMAVILTSIKVPEEERKAVVPMRDDIVIKLREEAKQKPKVIEPPKPVEKPRDEPEIKRPKEEPKPLTKEQIKAREKVEKTGIFKLKDQLADLVDTASAKTVVNQNISQAGAGSQAATANNNILTAGVGKGSGGVSDSRHSVNVGTTTTLAGSSQAAAGQVAQSAIKTTPQIAKGKSAQGEGVRAEEDVVSVLDQNKGTLNTLYRKARRSNPGLRGRLVLEITVQPNGSVSKVIVKSSELNDPTLEESIIARVKTLDFGVRKGGALTVVYPIEFLPG